MAGDDCAALTPAPALYERVCSSLLHGWRFWSLEGEAPEPKPPKAAKQPAKAKVIKKVRLLQKLPNQKGVPEGQVKWYCSACQKSFLVEGKDTPAACAEGHPLEQEDEFATTD